MTSDETYFHWLERPHKAAEKIAELGAEIERLRAEVERLKAMLRLIATPTLPGASCNRNREACRLLAEEALRDKP